MLMRALSACFYFVSLDSLINNRFWCCIQTSASSRVNRDAAMPETCALIGQQTPSRLTTSSSPDNRLTSIITEDIQCQMCFCKGTAGQAWITPEPDTIQQLSQCHRYQNHFTMATLCHTCHGWPHSSAHYVRPFQLAPLCCPLLWHNGCSSGSSLANQHTFNSPQIPKLQNTENPSSSGYWLDSAHLYVYTQYWSKQNIFAGLLLVKK